MLSFTRDQWREAIRGQDPFSLAVMESTRHLPTVTEAALAELGHPFTEGNSTPAIPRKQGS